LVTRVSCAKTVEPESVKFKLAVIVYGHGTAARSL